jgi:ABC-type multidrug transport system ATPase subunit
MLKLEKVGKTICKRQVLYDIDAVINDGIIVGLLGSNGAGKTTLLRIIAGLINPDTGSVKIDGKMVRYDRKKLRLQIGYMPEDGGLYKRLTVYENLRFTYRFYKNGIVPGSRLNQGLERFGMLDRRNEKTGSLSGGMRRKLLFLRAVIHEPKLLLLDEPFVGMDVESRQSAMEYILKMSINGSIVVVSSHATADLEMICDSYLFIKRGKLIYEGQLSKVEHGNGICRRASLSSTYLKIMRSA